MIDGREMGMIHNLKNLMFWMNYTYINTFFFFDISEPNNRFNHFKFVDHLVSFWLEGGGIFLLKLARRDLASPPIHITIITENVDLK